MKISKKIICIATMVVMLFSTMGVGTFAAVDQGITTKEAEQESMDAGSDISAESEELQSEETQSEEVQSEEASPEGELDASSGTVYDYHAITTGVRTVSGHQRIKICWPAYANPETKYYKVEAEPGKPVSYTYYEVTETLVDYILFRNGKAYKSGIKPAAGTTMTYEDKSVGDGLYTYKGTLHNGGKFAYKIVARTELKVNKLTSEQVPRFEEQNPNPLEAAEEIESTEVENLGQPQTATAAAAAASAKQTGYATCVRTSAVKLKLKTSKKLTSHDKKRVTRTFKKGTTIYTCGFGIGKHMFIYGENMYYLNRISTTSTSSITTKTPYNKETAEYFVNSRGDGSSTSRLIWVSVYTQHIYIFKGKAKKWKLEYCWKVSTGKSKTPTIRTIDPQGNLDSGRMIGKSKTICNKLKKRHGIPYWNCFSSYNAIHGKRAKWSIRAVPQSGGCVRNTNDHAKWVYYNCPKKTKVILF